MKSNVFLVAESLNDFNNQTGEKESPIKSNFVEIDPEDEFSDEEDFEDVIEDDDDGIDELPVGIESTDSYSDDDEEDEQEFISPKTIEAVELEDEIGETDDDLVKALNNELRSPEYARASIEFKIRGTNDTIEGIPISQLGGGTAYLFKTPDGKLKKVKVQDIILAD
jgi:hypothetical protein